MADISLEEFKTQAEAFLHLALMIAEQGFAHPSWAETLKRPPQWP